MMNEADQAHALLAQAVAHRNAGRSIEAYNAFLDFHRHFDGSTDPAVRLDLAEAMLNVAVIFMQMGQGAMALSSFDEVVSRYPEADESVAAALSNKIRLLMGTGFAADAAEALKACGELSGRFGDSTDPWMMGRVAGALSNQGITLIRQGRPGEAVAPLEEFCRRFGGSTDAYLLNQLACVLYNKGIALRDAGRRAEASAAFTEAVERFADSAVPESRRFAALALYNRAITQARLLDFEASVASAGELGRRFGDSDDPVILERLAKVLYHRAIACATLGMIQESVTDFAYLVRRFAGEQPEAIRAVVEGARRRGLFTAVTNPVGHASSNIFTRTDFMLWEEEARNAPPETAEQVGRNLESYRRQTDDEVKTAAAMHEQAASILGKYLYQGEPFGLLLRNFESESIVRMGTAGSTPVRLFATHFKHEAGAVEKHIAAAFKNRLPFFGIASNFPTPGYEHHLPKLEVLNEIWQPVVEELVKAAEIIFVNVTLLSPGVLDELNMIRRLDKTARTVVVISNGDQLMSDLMAGAYKASPPGPQASVGDEQLKPFPVTFYMEMLDEQPFQEWGIFENLLARVDAIRALEPSERVHHWDKVYF